jgi:hypothetical protein
MPVRQRLGRALWVDWGQWRRELARALDSHLGYTRRCGQVPRREFLPSRADVRELVPYEVWSHYMIRRLNSLWRQSRP